MPPGDRYQIVTEHKPTQMIVEDTGLGIPHSKDIVFVQMTTRPCRREKKELFYRLLTQKLVAACGITPADVMISTIENKDRDWSFGHSQVQFLSGEL